MARFGSGQGGRPVGAKNRTGREVRELARAYTQGAIDGLWDIARDVTKDAPVRVAAFREILDRGWGKPAQTVDATLTADVNTRVLTTFLISDLARPGSYIDGETDNSVSLPLPQDE